MRVSAVICAAGRGERAGFNKNKLLAPLCGAPALYHTLKAFCLPCIQQVVVACSAEDMAEITALCAPFGYDCVLGGATRTDSVFAALKACDGDIVLIHDGARPFVSREVIEGCIACAARSGSAICALPVTDTIALSEGGEIAEVPDRSALFSLQTPQGFVRERIVEAYERAAGDGRSYTDDSAVYARYIGRPALCEGSRDNIKLTFKSDFAQTYPPLDTAPGQAAGIGVDVHAFGPGDHVTLCGVSIPHDRGLVAHSDGDVAVHALMDALLSAAGMEDIGHLFPDTDPKYRGANSMALLERVTGLIRSRGWAPLNASITIRAEKPRIAPHICAMKGNIATALGIDGGRVGVSAGTCEKLGFVGEGLGIECAAAVLLERK